MPSRLTIESVAKYLQSHPLALDLSYLTLETTVDGKAHTVTASIATSKLGVTLPTTAEALKELESLGLVRSNKEGRVRYYTIPSAVVPVLDATLKGPGSTNLFRRRRYKGNRFPFRILVDRIYRELHQKAESHGVRLDRDFEVGTPIMPLRVDLMVEPKEGGKRAVELTYVSYADRPDRFLGLLGKMFLLSTKKDDFETILFLNLLAQGKSPGGDQWQPWQLNDIVTRLYGGKGMLIEEHPDEYALMSADYANNLARKIWETVGGS